MKITIFAAGSRGDIQPCVALGRGCSRQGIRFAWLLPRTLPISSSNTMWTSIPLRGDVQQIMASDTGREFMETRRRQSAQVDSRRQDDDRPGRS